MRPFGRTPVLVLTLSAAMAGAALAEPNAGAHPPEHQHDVMAPAEPVPGESIFQLEAELTDQDGRRVPLSALRGHPTLITMFYTSCRSVCPVITVALQRMEADLSPEERERLRVAMVSFDSARDTPATLHAFARSHGLDTSRWLLARAPEESVREVAAVLGVRYRQLPDGGFSHSAVIVLLDPDGVIRARTESLQQTDPAFMQALGGQLATSPPRPVP